MENVDGECFADMFSMSFSNILFAYKVLKITANMHEDISRILTAHISAHWGKKAPCSFWRLMCNSR